MLHRLAFSTNAFKQTDVHSAVRAIAAIGYRGVEIMADSPHLLPHAWSDEQTRELAKLITGLGLAVSNVNAFTGFGLSLPGADGNTYAPTWVDPSPARRQQRIDHTRRALELAAILGSPAVSIQPGGPYVNRDRDELDGLFAQGITACLDTARAANVRIAIEPEPGLLIERADQFDHFKHAHFADEPLVMMNCDTGHHFCVREDPAGVIRDYADVITHVHLEDISAERVHQHLVPGDGVMDFPAIFKALDDINFRGFVTVELYPYTSTAEQVARRAYDHLKKLLNAPGR
ncbi:MAG: sugar phosphate isomerase/epimerase family protein [Phycisphaerales bacterium]